MSPDGPELQSCGMGSQQPPKRVCLAYRVHTGGLGLTEAREGVQSGASGGEGASILNDHPSGLGWCGRPRVGDLSPRCKVPAEGRGQQREARQGQEGGEGPCRALHKLCS